MCSSSIVVIGLISKSMAFERPYTREVSNSCCRWLLGLRRCSSQRAPWKDTRNHSFSWASSPPAPSIHVLSLITMTFHSYNWVSILLAGLQKKGSDMRTWEIHSHDCNTCLPMSRKYCKWMVNYVNHQAHALQSSFETYFWLSHSNKII